MGGGGIGRGGIGGGGDDCTTQRFFKFGRAFKIHTSRFSRESNIYPHAMVIV